MWDGERRPLLLGEQHKEAAVQQYERIWRFIWILLFASLAAQMQYWLPAHSVYSVNLTSLVLNLSGAFMVAVVTTYQQMSVHFLQTHIALAAVKSGFLSVFTTFGNLIEDTARLYNTPMWWLSVLNFGGNLCLAFVTYQLGRLFALKLRAGTEFSFDLMRMEQEERRLAHELDVALQGEEAEEAAEEEEERHIAVAELAPDVVSGGAAADDDEEEEGALLVSEAVRPAGLTRRAGAAPAPAASSPAGTRATARTGTLDEALRARRYELLAQQSPLPQSVHWLLLGGMGLLPVVSMLVIVYAGRWGRPSTQSASHGESTSLLVWEFLATLVFCVLGALLGWYLGDKQMRRRGVMWGTFKVNLLSCILIGIAYNVLDFRFYFPHGEDQRFYIMARHFITDFCGSISSFAGLIDETSILWNSSVPKRVPIANLGYNLFLCLGVFLVVVYFFKLMLAVVWAV